MARGGGPVRVGHERVVQEDVDVILRRQEGSDVALENEIRLDCSRDRLLDLGIGRKDQLANLAAYRLLSVGQGLDVRINMHVPGIAHGGLLRLVAIDQDADRLLLHAGRNPTRRYRVDDSPIQP